MRALTLQQTGVARGEQQQQQQQQQQGAMCGRSLFSNYAPPTLENRLLAQTSMTLQPSSLLVTSCAALQPSSLSSTSSSLLSTPPLSPALTSPLLSTQNKLLTSGSPRPSFPLTSSLPRDSLLSTSLASGALLSRYAQPPSCLHQSLSGEHKSDVGGDEAREEISQVVQSRFEETSVQHSVEDDVLPEGEDEVEGVDGIYAGSPMEMPTLETELIDQEVEQTLAIREEEFAEFDGGTGRMEEELIHKKYFLLNAVCCSLVNKDKVPGQKDWDSEGSSWTRIINLAKDISDHDPQFLLKLAVYTRQELNIRITANFLLALAASQPSTKSHVRRYFCAAVQLPSDWLEVVRLYSTCFSHSLPMCLKKSMADKFKQFSEYQLAKYNTRKHRCKHNPKSRKAKKPVDEQLVKWGKLLRIEASALKKFLHSDDSKVDKKQSEFSIKKLIKRLHIKEPAEHVMAILGKKYPADVKAFTHSGMAGVWDRERAGQRMRLKEPETWERLLSREGNKAATWEKLIDNKSLPFMAMLRNLRNMITAGISEAHHRKILSRLTNKKAVIQSRQFPFRFLAAYKVIMELQTLASATQQALPTTVEILKGILKKIPKSRQVPWETSSRSRVKATLGVPIISRLYQMRKAQLIKANQRLYSAALLDQYRKALETAVQISCRYNVPPLPGRTVIILPSHINTDQKWQRKQDFCLPPDPEQKNEEGETVKDEDRLTPSALEVAVLLSVMISSCAEDSQLLLCDWRHGTELKLKSDVLLENVRGVMQQIEDRKCNMLEESETDYLARILNKKNKVDNIILLADYSVEQQISYFVRKYREETNNSTFVVELLMARSEWCLSDQEEHSVDSNCVTLVGFGEQILRFLVERGSQRLLDHVEHLDKVYNIPPPEGAKGPETANPVVPIPATPKLRWRGVRVFISSTFRDMHAERDVLVQSVFPELRRRAAPHCLHLQEVELRWGVTEEESGRATELCLSEVCRSHMMVGILGERYGLVPPKPVLPDLPQYGWLVSAPAGLSITEMEIRQFQALFPDTAHQRMFCYFRDPNISKLVPVAWRSDFVPESKESESKMTSLKSQIRDSGVKVTENYPCEWGGVVDGKPYLKNLEDFGRAVLEDLWTAVQKQFVQDEEEVEAVSDVTEQEVHQGALQRQFFGRAKLLSAAVEIVEQVQAKGGVMVLEGGPGEGKTVFMAALADALRTGVKSRGNQVCDVISYSAAASQSARMVENLLRYLVRWFRKMKDAEKESPLPHSYRDLLSEFHSTLSDMKPSKPVVLVVDGVDVVRDGRGQPNSDWIPQQLPKGVCLVVSITSKAALLQTLAKKRGSVLFTLAQLTVPDRKEIVQKGLDSFGKKLSDSAFNNQLQTLVMKKGAVSPLYLHLACEDLRNFASFDKLKESLEGLPQSMGQLVQHSLDRLCSQHRGMLGLRWALAALTVSTTGLRERDLYSVLNVCNDLSSRSGRLSWQEVLHLSRKPRGRIPMAMFTRIVQSLQSLIGLSHCHGADDLLALTNPEVRRAFEDFLLPTESDRTRAHLVLAARLWALADPQGTDTFLHCEANSVLHLPSNLIRSDQLEALHFLLSSYYFLYANVRHGLLHHLLEAYSLFDKKRKPGSSFGVQDHLEDCRSFLRRHAPLFSSWPPLFIQQALNEPPESSAHAWAQGLLGRGGVRVVEWLNNKSEIAQETNSELVSTFSSEPTCVVESSDGELMVVGTGQGMLHFINTQTGQKVKSLVSSCDGISSCVFLKDGRLATTSFDGRIEIWDIGTGCRTALVEGHTNTITASDISVDLKHFATVSLDFMLKVWSATKGNEVASMLSSSPLNCVTFDPEGHLLAAGCWNGNVIVWNWLRNKIHASLSGHQRSVRSLSFSSSSSTLCSGSISGEVRVWSVPTSTCVGCFQAHCGATEALAFLDEGAMLLSAGSDHMLQLWSGGLGRSVTALKSDDCEQEPPQKKMKSANSVSAALCVAVNGDYIAVGYKSEGIKYFSLDTGEMSWASSVYDMTILCLLWVAVDAEQSKPELLVSGGSDKRLRVWKREEGEEGKLREWGMFGMQSGVILALAQSSTYLATASDDFTIALWLLSDLALDPAIDPHALLRGHGGGVTCLAFSPDGGQLLSGGKDQALMVWDVNSSPAARSKSLPHSHRDWITACVWTPDCVISSSNDGRLCLWDLEAGQCLREMPWRNPLTSLCCLGKYVMAGCAEGSLHVWNWETNVEICHIVAHKQRIHHCAVLTSTDKTAEINPEEMTVFTASDDNTVKLWKPLEMEHFGTFQGHSGAVNGVLCKRGVPEFLTFSEDRSLRCWSWTAKSPVRVSGAVTAVCFSREDDLCLAGYTSGLLELWQNNTVIAHKQASSSTVTAICSMPRGQFAVAYLKNVVDLWELVWNQQHSTASLVKVTTYTPTSSMAHLYYCSSLIGVSHSGTILNITTMEKDSDWRHTVTDWSHDVRVFGFTPNDGKSMWLLGEQQGEINLGFLLSMPSVSQRELNFVSVTLSCNSEEKEKQKKKSLITAAAVDTEFIVCGDIDGNMWFNQPPELSSWTCRKPAHSDKISVLRLTKTIIISASYDRTVKLWDRNTKKQVGMFVCGGPVLVLEVNPEKPTLLVCGDGQGKLYFLSWKE